MHSGAFTTCASAEELRQPSAHSGHRDRNEREIGFLVESYGEDLVHAAFRPASPCLISEYDGCTADGEGGEKSRYLAKLTTEEVWKRMEEGDENG